MIHKEVLEPGELKSRRLGKLRFDYAVRISAAEVLRKKDANQTTRIFANNSLNTHFLTFLIIFRPFLPNW